jgi:cytochrome c oxidase cbb3-type subunit 3
LVRARPGRVALLLALVPALSLVACRQEERRVREPLSAADPGRVAQGDLRPGGHTPAATMANPYEGNAHAIGEGRRLWAWFNCNGCHFGGGGGIGPALMDTQWIYGSDPAQIFTSIVDGRPDGMPAYRDRLNDQQVWQLVAYIQTLGGVPDSKGKPTDRPLLPGGSPE